MKLSTAGFSAPRSAAASADPPLCTRARHKAAGGAGPRASDTQDRAKHGSAAGLLPASAWRRGEEALGWGKFSLRTKERVPPGQPRATRSSIITPPSNPTPLAAAAHPIPGSLSQPLPKVPTSLVGTRALGASAGPQHSWVGCVCHMWRPTIWQRPQACLLLRQPFGASLLGSMQPLCNPPPCGGSKAARSRRPSPAGAPAQPPGPPRRPRRAARPCGSAVAHGPGGVVDRPGGRRGCAAGCSACRARCPDLRARPTPSLPDSARTAATCAGMPAPRAHRRTRPRSPRRPPRLRPGLPHCSALSGQWHARWFWALLRRQQQGQAWGPHRSPVAPACSRSMLSSSAVSLASSSGPRLASLSLPPFSRPARTLRASAARRCPWLPRRSPSPGAGPAPWPPPRSGRAPPPPPPLSGRASRGGGSPGRGSASRALARPAAAAGGAASPPPRPAAGGVRARSGAGAPGVRGRATAAGGAPGEETMGKGSECAGPARPSCSSSARSDASRLCQALLAALALPAARTRASGGWSQV